MIEYLVIVVRPEQRREFLAVPFKYFNKQHSHMGSEGVVKVPAPPQLPDRGIDLALSIAAYYSKAQNFRLGRRELLASTVAGTALLINGRQNKAEAQQYQIEDVEYTPLHGRQSFPWLPLDPRVEGLAATGRNPGGVLDKYDELDREINGARARSAWWQSTRDWFEGIYRDNVNESNFRWAGFCAYAAAAAWFSPPIEGSIVVLGREFSERERLQLATLYFAGMKRDPLYTEITPDVVGVVRDDYFAQGVPVIVDRSDNPQQNWWVLKKGNSRTGFFITTEFLTHLDTIRLKEAHYNPVNLRQIAVLNPDVAQPGEEGAFVFVDKRVAGLVIGTEKLAV